MEKTPEHLLRGFTFWYRMHSCILLPSGLYRRCRNPTGSAAKCSSRTYRVRQPLLTVGYESHIPRRTVAISLLYTYEDSLSIENAKKEEAIADFGSPV